MGVTESEPAKIIAFEIEARLDVTLRVGENDFYKPGASGRLRFNSLPSEKAISDAYAYLLFNVVDPQIEGALEKVNERLEIQRHKEAGG
ncbi:hypothetical protein LINSTU_192 [Mycobacterium phage LinStu]|nr:hypothetical protein SCOTTMCG_187 [Mycobacterium phage ScottMcG]YP_003347831.1 hypothetical protein ET08_181 [Mycobacterium phage ET08]YP_009014752.1 hypothetical protein LINSTU_192 [Mycobacterium phage LinStu]YP_009204720.1 hypothetical protein HYRO_182 [Mycobacterium phage HyRo]YP_010057567.1 hypothetical protein KHO60_gp153 [Mycobacterium phage CharlieB]YP_010057803.1 hypothetical protein KHO61_gp155 [Mycobacterium phage Mangeria]ACU41681.1 hypothetical protein LRRHOOD_186 [Mycobacteriu